MRKIGILAYGSLIEDPGVELKPLISERVNDVETPFKIEFARSSWSRDGAPTVVPVVKLGAPVKGVILVLNETVEFESAKDLLWRRETRNEGSKRHYQNPVKRSLNEVVIVTINDLCGVDVVIYTSIGANIPDSTPSQLARLAIDSAKGRAGQEGKDGISYLISLKRQKITTPLMARYEAKILNMLGVSSLQDALERARTPAVSN